MSNIKSGAIGHVALGAGERMLTATQIIHRQLRDEIVSLHRLPGEPISEKEIAQECGVSRTPIREALLRLSEERLVDIVPKSGTSVAKIPLLEVLESGVARAALEQVTVKAAVERAAGSEIAHMRALLLEQREWQEAGDHERFYAADEALHRVIALSADFPGIWSIIERTKLQVDRYRLLTLPQPKRMERVLQEHTDVVEAIAARDTNRALKAMNVHLDGLCAEDLVAIRDLNPSYFIGDLNEVYQKWGDDGLFRPDKT